MYLIVHIYHQIRDVRIQFENVAHIHIIKSDITPNREYYMICIIYLFI